MNVYEYCTISAKLVLHNQDLYLRRLFLFRLYYCIPSTDYCYILSQLNLHVLCLLGYCVQSDRKRFLLEVKIPSMTYLYDLLYLTMSHLNSYLHTIKSVV